jgi:hypothetical protein
MTDDPLQRRADVLAARVEALAEALRDGGVSEEASTHLLARASAAVLQALNLEALHSAESPSSAQRSIPPRASYCVIFDAPDESFRTLAAFQTAA